MTKHDYKIVYDPENVESLKPQEITTHSSMLTNKRWHDIFTSCDIFGMDAWDLPFSVDKVHRFYSALRMLYNEVRPILNEPERFELDNIFNKYLYDFTHKSNLTTNDFVNRIDSLNTAHIQIIQFLQNRKYFIKWETVEAKGLDAIIEKYEKMPVINHNKKKEKSGFDGI